MKEKRRTGGRGGDAVKCSTETATRAISSAAEMSQGMSARRSGSRGVGGAPWVLTNSAVSGASGADPEEGGTSAPPGAPASVPLGVLGQAFADDALKFHRNAGSLRGQRLGLLVDDFVEQSLGIEAPKGRLPADHFIEHAAQRPDVGAVVDLHTLGLLGAHVGGGSERRVQFGELRARGEQRQPEVHDGDVALVVDDGIGGFDVAMNDVFFVGRFQAARDLASDIERLGDGNRARFDSLVKALAFDKGEHHEGSPIGLGDFVNGANVGMPQSGGRLGFAPETLAGVLILEKMRREELQRHRPIEFGVLGLVDHAHAAFAELGGDLVVVDGFADHASIVAWANV